jgi:dephospho-CoA kinase
MIIGITGGIGSGKSTIAKQLREMGYNVYDTDSEAKRLIIEDAHVRKQITELFGPKVYQDGMYQTAFVAQQVFTNKTLLSRLNAIVHPAVKKDILSRHSISDTQQPFFIECAILYTAHLNELCDMVIAVTAPEDVRLARTIARDHSDIDKVRARMQAQNVEEDLHNADIVITNDGSTSISILCKQLLAQLKLG